MANVRMYHDCPEVTGGAVTADVPKEAVEWMRRDGWYLKADEPVHDDTPSAPKKKKADK